MIIKPIKDIYKVIRANKTANLIKKNYSDLIRGGTVTDINRIYFYHIRKTAGTSINYMFFELGGEDVLHIHKELCNNYWYPTNKGIFNAWDKHLLEKGLFFYGYSHIPMHKIKIPKDTFTFTCLRDPVERILSHYKMLLRFKLNNKKKHPTFKEESKWLGETFGDFLRSIPKEHLFNQLYMFSKDYNVDEAVKKVKECSFIVFFDDFENGIKNLSMILSLELKIKHLNTSPKEDKLSSEEIKVLKKMLKPEYDFYNEVLKLKQY